MLEKRSAIPNRRAVAVVWVPGMAGVLVGVVELAAGIEPVETIGHHQPQATLRMRISPTRRLTMLAVEEYLCLDLGRWFWSALPSFPVHRPSPRFS